MKTIQTLNFHPGTNEELLPGFESEFPYLASNAKLDKYPDRSAPWHWHKAVELFYMESGTLEYDTPKKKMTFPAGSGGFLNSNVLHMTRALSRTEENIQLLHLIRDAFLLSENDAGYEIRLRNALSEIWLGLFALLSPAFGENEAYDKNDRQLKRMLVYIHEHFAEPITVPELAAVACLSERECFRLFQSYLHTTPVKYIQSFRLQEFSMERIPLTGSALKESGKSRQK